jgi:hypothetical protein
MSTDNVVFDREAVASAMHHLRTLCPNYDSSSPERVNIEMTILKLTHLEAALDPVMFAKSARNLEGMVQMDAKVVQRTAFKVRFFLEAFMHAALLKKDSDLAKSVEAAVRMVRAAYITT